MRRTPWTLESGGPGSGLWRSADGGDTWTEMTRKPGLPGGTVGIIGAARLRRDGSIIPRMGIVGDPIHRLDMRLQKRLSLGGHRQIEGLLEVFNLFNHANYGAYVINESNANYGKPSSNDNLAYQPRMLQLGFRTTF